MSGWAKSWTRPARQCIYYWFCNQEYIINRSHFNPYPTGTLSSFHLSIENLPHEVSVSADSLSGSSVTSGSSAEMNEENQWKQTVNGSQKLIIWIKNNRLEFRRTSSVPNLSNTNVFTSTPLLWVLHDALCSVINNIDLSF